MRKILRKILKKRKKRKENKFLMDQVVVCNDCKEKYVISVPFDIAWDNGNLKCKCGKIIKYNNDRIKTLYI